MAMVFVGDDWAEDHHDVCVMDESGRRLAQARVPERLPGMGRLQSSWPATLTMRVTS